MDLDRADENGRPSSPSGRSDRSMQDGEQVADDLVRGALTERQRGKQRATDDDDGDGDGADAGLDAGANGAHGEEAADAPASSEKDDARKPKSLPPSERAPRQLIPPRNLVAIEYPGLIPLTQPQGGGDGAAGSEGYAEATNLDRALATLSPHPPPLGTPQGALKHIAQVLLRHHQGIGPLGNPLGRSGSAGGRDKDKERTKGRGANVPNTLECRLGAPYFPLRYAEESADESEQGRQRGDQSKGKGKASSGSAAKGPAVKLLDSQQSEADRLLSQAQSQDPHLPAPASGETDADAEMEVSSSAPDAQKSTSPTRRMPALSPSLANPPTSGPIRPLVLPPDFRLDSRLYQHPIHGFLVDTNNPVIRIRRRRWKRKQRSAGEENEEERKEYMIEMVGTSKQTVRYRYAADFAYEPEVGHLRLTHDDVLHANLPPGLPERQPDWDHRTTPGGTSATAASGRAEAREEAAERRREDYRKKIAAMTEGPHGTVLRKAQAPAPAPASSSVGASSPTAVNKTLALHAALLTMNTRALRAFKFDPELQEYEKEVSVPRNGPGNEAVSADAVQRAKMTLSNLRSIPPPVFAKPLAPYAYL